MDKEYAVMVCDGRMRGAMSMEKHFVDGVSPEHVDGAVKALHGVLWGLSQSVADLFSVEQYAMARKVVKKMNKLNELIGELEGGTT